MGLCSPPTLVLCEIPPGGFVGTSCSSSCRTSVLLQQHHNYSFSSLRSANFISSSHVATVPDLPRSTWYRRRKSKNFLGSFWENSVGTISFVKFWCPSQHVQQREERGCLCNFRRGSLNVSSFVNYSISHGKGKRFQFPGSSCSTTVQSSARIGTQQPLAASSLPRSLEDKVSEGISKDQNTDSRSDTDVELGSIGDLNQISSLQVRSEEVPEADDEQMWPVDDDTPLTVEVENVPQPKRKKKGLGVRKPSQEVEKADFATRFGLSPQVPASNGQASQLEEASNVEYYAPKVGDEVIGVIVSGNEFKLEVNIGAQHLGRVLTKDIYPVDVFRSEVCFWESPVGEEGEVQEFPTGRVRVVRDEEVFSLQVPARAPIMEVGSVLRFKVQGVTLSGRAVLSSRRIAFPLAWERLRQIQKLNEPIEVEIYEWNSGGLLSRIEGLRAFLPLNHLLNRAVGTGSLKTRVGERIRVLITEVDEQTGKLIISEKRAWGLKNLRPGTLHDGVVNKIFPFGVEVNLLGTSLRGMIHISNVSRSRVKDLQQVFQESEPVTVMVVRSPVRYRIALSTADLESSKGLILEDKEKVFREAEEMAARFRSTLPVGNEEEEDQDIEGGMVDVEVSNWDWLDFGQETEFGQADNEQ